jgi:hypothetical protein
MQPGGLCSQRRKEGSWHHVGLHSADYDGDAATDAATKALPQIDPLVVAACKERNPNFGNGGGAKSQPQRTADDETAKHIE